MELDPKLHERLPDGRIKLQGGVTSSAGGFALLAFSILWTGGSGFGFYMAGRDDTPLVARLFIGLFVLVGVLMFVGGIVLIVKRAMVNQKIGPAAMTISNLPLRLGQRFTVEFEQTVRQQCQIDQVGLTLICREWVEYQQGTDTRHATKDVLTDEYPLLTGGELPPGGNMKAAADITIPAESMHTFDAPHNKVKWLLALRTTITSWPDYTAEFTLLVEPRMAPEPTASETEDQS